MSLKIVVLAKQVPDTRNVGKDAMNADGRTILAFSVISFKYNTTINIFPIIHPIET